MERNIVMPAFGPMPWIINWAKRTGNCLFTQSLTVKTADG